MENLDLIVIENDVITTTTLMIAEIFKKQHKNVLQKLESLDCSKEFRRLNFKPSNYFNSQGKSQPVYNVTRDGWTMLVMGFTGKKAMIFKEKYIAAFNAMEAKLKGKEQFEIPKTYAEALMLSAKQAAKIEADLPKVRFHDAVKGSADGILIGDFAKLLKSTGVDIGRNKLFALLRERGYLMKNNVPYQSHMNSGLFSITETTYDGKSGVHLASTTKITGKGQIYFQKKLSGRASKQIKL